MHIAAGPRLSGRRVRYTKFPRLKIASGQKIPYLMCLV